MTHIEQLQDAIRALHSVESTHRESVPVKETWQGKTVWDGIVEVFTLHGHPITSTAYAWMHDNGKAVYPVTVLHIHPALTPQSAVKAFIVQEYRNAAQA